MRGLIIAALVCATGAPAQAHDEWANGKPIPDWVKSSCCGPADAHHLRPEQVHQLDSGDWRVDGYNGIVKASAALPSQDGDYWIFYKDEPEGDYYSPEGGKSHHGAYQTGVYCFFVPMAF